MHIEHLECNTVGQFYFKETNGILSLIQKICFVLLYCTLRCYLYKNRVNNYNLHGTRIIAYALVIGVFVFVLN